MAARMEEKKCSLWLSRALDCFSINTSVSLKTGERTKNTKPEIHLSVFYLLIHGSVKTETLTWRGGVDTCEEQLSTVQDTGSQWLMFAHLFLKTLTSRASASTKLSAVYHVSLNLDNRVQLLRKHLEYVK